MRLDPARWLDMLRRRRRAILCAVLPALALSAASGPACAAMIQSRASAAIAEVPSSHDSHATHHHNAAHADEPAAPAVPCPHCPLESGAANAGHASCVTVEAQEDGGTAPTKASSTPLPPVFLASWLLPAARASPPLIGPPQTHTVPHADTVTLTIRHCVLLI